MLVAAVESTTLSVVAYDEAKEVLRLQFCSGATYEYSYVPAAVHAELLKAASKGGFFNRAIRGRFPFRPVPSAWMAGAR
jgi:KTSC domain